MQPKLLLPLVATLLCQSPNAVLAVDVSGTTPGPFWATLISPDQYVSSHHFTAGPGSPITFLSGDSAVTTGYVRQATSDCVVGTLDRAVAGTAYGFALVTNGQPIHVVTRRGVIDGRVTWVGFAYGEPCFRHNVSVYGGDSGAPTFDASGNLVGTHHYTCGEGCGIDVHLGALFGLQPPAATNTVVVVGGGNTNDNAGATAPPPAAAGGNPSGPHIPRVLDVEMFLP